MKSLLKLAKHDEKKEIEFEMNYLASLTVEQRFRMLFQKSDEMKKVLLRNGHRKAFEIIKRK
ncbi:MAG: hypothetical protein AABY84_10695 [Candidatus Firestonebacteria bacterium]